jgi:type VI secretion system protein ImpF
VRETETDYVPTVMDRLISPLGETGEIGARRRGDEEELAASITRDLHTLLNARRQEFLVPPEFEEVATSIVNFGLPDFTSCGNLRFTSEQGKLCRWIEEAIRTYEPRLRNVTVRVLDKENVTTVLRFRVEAKSELTADRLSFDMGLKRDSGEFAVSQG